MKKLLSVILALVLLIITSVCYAENNVALYEEKLKGTSWKIVYTTLSKSEKKIVNFTSEKRNPKDINDRLGLLNSYYLTGDETGEVYLYSFGTGYIIWGRLTLTEDETVMILYVGDNPSVILVKQ